VSSWNYVWTPPTAGSYGVQARAGDNAGNWDSTTPYNAFTVYAGQLDTTPPSGSFAVPTVNQQLPNGTLTFSGVATDNLAVSGAQVAIKNSATGQWWTGSGWGGFTWLNATLASPNSTSSGWSFTWTPPATGSYGVQLQVKDAAGLANSPKPFVSFRVV
jgi:hypothetical protein